MIGTTATAPVGGVGLALLLQQGVPAWLRAVSTCISSSPGGSATARSAPTSDDQDTLLPMPRGLQAGVIPWAQHAEVATLLVGLVLSARPPRRDPVTCNGGS